MYNTTQPPRPPQRDPLWDGTPRPNPDPTATPVPRTGSGVRQAGRQAGRLTGPLSSRRQKQGGGARGKRAPNQDRLRGQKLAQFRSRNEHANCQNDQGSALATRRGREWLHPGTCRPAHRCAFQPESDMGPRPFSGSGECIKNIDQSQVGLPGTARVDGRGCSLAGLPRCIHPPLSPRSASTRLCRHGPFSAYCALYPAVHP